MAQTITVDSTPGVKAPTLYFSQGDIGRDLVVSVVSRDGFHIPAGATVKMKATKPSGFGFVVTGTVSGDNVTFTTTETMTNESGRFQAELVITYGDDVIGSANFFLEGEPNPHPDGTVDGDAENPTLEHIDVIVTRATNDWLDDHPEATTTVQDNSLTTAKYVDGSITTDKIADKAVTKAKLADAVQTKIDLIDTNASNISSLGSRVTTAEGEIDDLQADLATLVAAVGSPLVAATAADMTDQTKIYVYTGSETGYVNGDWYYYDGSAWAVGGVYNSFALSTDTTLSVAGAAADAKTVGDDLNDLKDDLNEIIDNDVTITEKIEYSDMTITDGYYLKNGVEKSSNGFGIVDYIAVESGQELLIHYARYDATNSQIALYDSDKEYIGNASDVTVGTVYITNAVMDVAVTIPNGAAYIRYTTRTNLDGTTMLDGGTFYIADSYVLISEKKPLYVPYGNISDCILNACALANPKKIITWIDDDTGSDAYVGTVKTICDNLGVKCTFATITDRWGTVNAASVATLQQLQKEGFHITTHSGNHKRWYTNDGALPIFTAQELETDLIESLEALNQNGFIDSDMLIYPGSSATRADVDVKAIVKKWCRCAVKTNGTNFTSYGDGKYLINRAFFDKENKTTQYYKDLLDTFSGEAWVVFGSHSNNASQFDSTMISTVLQYALDNGWTIMTLNEALKYREKYYAVQDLFSLT